jgi:RimJ/RimL family protein N-acetyltransferase
VKIEPVSLAHAGAVQRLACDPGVIATTNLPDPYPEHGAEAWIRYLRPRHEAGVEYAFAMIAGPEEAGAEQVVGVCGLLDVSAEAAEMGYWVGRPFWGRGYATAACAQLVAFAFDRVPVRRLHAYPLARNRASCRVLEKLGFALEGLRLNRYPKWHPSDRLAAYVLQSEQWHARRNGS